MLIQASIKRFVLLLYDVVRAVLYSGLGFPSPGYYGANLTTAEEPCWARTLQTPTETRDTNGPECSFKPPLSDLFFCFMALSGLFCIQDRAILLLDIMEQISPQLWGPVGQEYSRRRQRRVTRTCCANSNNGH
ncbi:hypothetical protein CDAR_592081 [Caerostris darwini]|uniref:Uncharacterized protein n=1 Tax=Caerostris darwini TaxID=1538125 RepID=A0AAV4W221_9ARAC|nr:hypothetical protein CDAR_592081 [Caerostris darwini]